MADKITHGPRRDAVSRTLSPPSRPKPEPRKPASPKPLASQSAPSSSKGAGGAESKGED